MDGPVDLSIVDAGAQLREGRFTSIALTEAHLGRIAERDPIYRAFVTVTGDRALEDAARADRDLAAGIDRGPLHGIPMALKDLIDTAGIRTTSGARLREHNVPTRDAEVAERLSAGGAVLLGKLATYEFATVGPDFDTPFPPARNPWKLEHITGGSSSGSAAAVAGGLVRTTLGSDTAGSIRGPASYCGVVGLKPTKGLVPTAGTLPLSVSLDHVGPISATVAEAAITLDVVSGRSGTESTARFLGIGIEGLRIGYARNWFIEDPEVMPAVVAAMDDAASHLSLLGARIEQVDLPDYELFRAPGITILNAESYALHRDDLRDRPGKYGPLSRHSLLSGASIDAAALAEALRAKEAITRQLDASVFSAFDALITVCTLTTALPLSAFEGKTEVWTPMRTLGFNVTGHPVLTLPIGFHHGLPIGMQIVGKYFEEALICQIGHAFERSTDHSAQRPPAPAVLQKVSALAE